MTDGTPFVDVPLQQLLELHVINDQEDAVLNGTLDVDDINILEAAIVWMKELVYGDGEPSPADTTITLHHFKCVVKLCNVNNHVTFRTWLPRLKSVRPQSPGSRSI
jgi:hypothetical protein